jgi:lysophospholipase L1-like esterase
MAPAPVFARGLGDATVADQTFFLDKLAAPSHPRAIFIYAGENDVVNGLSPQEVLADFKTFMDLKTKLLGATPVYFIAAKASPARLGSARDQQIANELVEAMAKGRKDLHYVDVAHDMWEGGKLLGTLKPIYRPDGIHLTEEGYAIWTRIMKPAVDKEAARKNACKG